MSPMSSFMSWLAAMLIGCASFLLVTAMPALPALAQVGGIPAFNVSEGDGGSTYSLSLQILALMTALTVLPSLVLGMTSFTRIIIVSILRQAMGTQQTPPTRFCGDRVVPDPVHHGADLFDAERRCHRSLSGRALPRNRRWRMVPR